MLSRSLTITYSRSSRISCTKRLTRVLVFLSRDEGPLSTRLVKKNKPQSYYRRGTRRFRGQSLIRCKFSPLNRLEGEVSKPVSVLAQTNGIESSKTQLDKTKLMINTLRERDFINNWLSQMIAQSRLLKLRTSREHMETWEAKGRYRILWVSTPKVSRNSTVMLFVHISRKISLSPPQILSNTIVSHQQQHHPSKKCSPILTQALKIWQASMAHSLQSIWLL